MIYDFLSHSRSGGFVNSGENCSQFGSLTFQFSDSSRWQQSAFFNQLEPKERFVGFFQYAPDFVIPISLTTSAAGGAITGGHRSCGSQDLIGKHPQFCCFMECL